LGGSFGIETFPAQQVVQGTHPIAQSPEPEAQSLNNTDDSSSMSGLPTTGGMAGLLKTMIIEWQGVQAKLVDFSSQASPAEICQGIVDELLHADEGLEVGYLDGKRISVKVVRKELQNSDFPPLNPPVDGGIKGVVEKDWVVLVTGGARGITSEIALELAPIGLTFILVGRTPEPDQEDSRTSSITEAGELRKFLLEQAKTKGEYITPAQVEEQISRLLRDREIRRNIVRLRDTGATVEYLPVDVREERQVKKLLDYIYDHYGRLDAILHGAGIIEDKLIVDKQADSFDRVFDTKVDSAFLISRYVRPEMLKLLVFFTSLAGRFGNRGQADYAAANEVLNRFAWRLHREWRNTRILAINWGPWDYGMVTEEVKKQFRARGVIPIPVKAGRRFFSNELKYGSVEDVELIAGEGPWVERCE